MAYLKHIEINRKSETLPIPLADVKAYLYVDFSDDDSLITSLTWATIEQLQAYLGRVIAPSTCKAIYMQSGGDEVRLCYADNIVLDSGSKYEVKGGSIFTCDEFIELSYEAGYTTLPYWLRDAILTSVAYKYEHRGDEQVNVNLIDTQTKEIVKPFVKWSFI